MNGQKIMPAGGPNFAACVLDSRIVFHSLASSSAWNSWYSNRCGFSFLLWYDTLCFMILVSCDLYISFLVSVVVCCMLYVMDVECWTLYVMMLYVRCYDVMMLWCCMLYVMMLWCSSLLPVCFVISVTSSQECGLSSVCKSVKRLKLALEHQ